MNTDNDIASFDYLDEEFDDLFDSKELQEIEETVAQTEQLQKDTRRRPHTGTLSTLSAHNAHLHYEQQADIKQEERDSQQEIEDLRHKLQIAEYEKSVLERKMKEQARQQAIISETEQILSKKKKRMHSPTIEPSTIASTATATQQQPYKSDAQGGFRVLPPVQKRKGKKRTTDSPFTTASASGNIIGLSSQLHSTLFIDSQPAPSDDKEADMSISADEMPVTRRPSLSIPTNEEPPQKISKMETDNPPVITSSSNMLLTAPSSAEDYRNLLQNVFQDLFLEWNRKHHQYKMNYSMALTAENIDAWSKQYASYFIEIPPSITLSKPHQQRLDLISTEIQYYLSGQVQDAKVIAHAIIIQFGYCLPICIQYKLYSMLEIIALTLNRITTVHGQQQYQTAAIQRLYTEFNSHSSHAVLYQLIQCFALFTFKYNSDRVPMPLKQQVIMKKYAHMLTKTLIYSDITAIESRHGASVLDINAAVEALRTPKEASSTKTLHCILEILQKVGRQYPKQPMFLSILTDGNFLRLLSEETPIDILFSCLGLLEIILQANTDWAAADGDRLFEKELFEKEQGVQHALKGLETDIEQERARLVPEIILRLNSLLQIPQKTYSWKDWYRLRRRITEILCNMCQVKLSPQILERYQVYVFVEMMKLMKKCCQAKEMTQSQAKQHRLLVRDGFRTVHTILKYEQPAGLCADYHTITVWLDLINYYLASVAADEHPAKHILLDIEQVLEKEKEKQSNEPKHEVIHILSSGEQS